MNSTQPVSPSRGFQFLVGSAALVIIVGALRVAQPLVVPFLLSAFLAIICGPPMHWLHERGLPIFVSALLVIAAAAIVFILLIAVVGSSIQDFAAKVPEYRHKLVVQRETLIDKLDESGLKIPKNLSQESFDPERLITFFTALLGSLGSAFSNGFLVLLTLIFTLVEASTFPNKLRAMTAGSAHAVLKMFQMRDAVRHYIAIKTGLSLLTALLVVILLNVMKIDYPLLWGLLAFFFNFVPNIGSIIAAVPAVLLALLQYGFQDALITAGGYLAINVMIGNVLEPRVMGRGLGLSPLVVFVSLVFWGWVLGPIGMLLSVPLTMIIKIVLDSSDETRWAAILLGDNSTGLISQAR